MQRLSVAEIFVNRGGDALSPLPTAVRALEDLLSELGSPFTLAGSWQGQDPCLLKWRGVVCDTGAPQKIVSL